MQECGLYIRVSALRQRRFGLDIEAQREAVNRFAAAAASGSLASISKWRRAGPGHARGQAHLSAARPGRARRDAPSSLRSSTACSRTRVLLQPDVPAGFVLVVEAGAGAEPLSCCIFMTSSAA